ncbi:MAG: dihydrofolate reductase [Candidatus Levybacteria bacterium]|nr:dihydrofolate reductase [Candidatus Levybacteria bacterium]
MKISIIAAMDEKRGIGKDNKIPWHIKEDFRRFKTLTSGHAIIMGRKTWESLPIKPLPNRTNIVITRDPASLARRGLARLNGLEVVRSLEEALRRASLAQGDDECFVIGGGQIFEQTIGLADKLYLTIVKGDFGADAFFPDYSEFEKKKVVGEGESEGHKYTFLELERNN